MDPRPTGTIIPQPYRPKRRWLRVLVITVFCLLVIGMALVGGSYLWLSGQVHKSNARLDPGIEEAIQQPASAPLVSVPEPAPARTILILGGDQESGASGRSDVIILVRVTSDYLSMLSIPRDLWVDVPGHGKAKINAAYAYGGPALSIKTIKQVTGVNIDSYVELNFQVFKDITDELGGVYVDVDHRYFDDSHDWGPIDLAPGYQLLTGQQALDFVRYRHDLNIDFGRNARQQRVLAAWREQAVGWDLPFMLPKLVSKFFDSATTDLSTSDVVKLAYAAVKLDASQVRHVAITGYTPTIDGQSVVTASKEEIQREVTYFLNGESEPATPASAAGGAVVEAQGVVAARATSGTVGAQGPPARPAWLPGATRFTVSLPGSLPDVDAWSALQAAVPYALQAPGFIPDGYSYFDQNPKDPGTYPIKVGGGTKPAVKVVYRYEKSDLYVGITQTTWLDAPAASKGTEIVRNGVTFTLIGSGDQIDRIWWKTGNVLHILSNTLFCTVSREDMVKMAESMTQVVGGATSN